jgi:hypothetical protein
MGVHGVQCLLDNPVLPEELKATLSEMSPHLAQQVRHAVIDLKPVP